MFKKQKQVMLFDALPKNDVFSPENLRTLPYQTPFLFMDLETVGQRFKTFKTVLPGLHIHYAMKANPDIRLLEFLRDAGCRFEIASYSELEILMGIGVSPNDVLFSNPVKLPSHIAAAYKAGLRRFAFSSRGELQKFTQYAPNAQVYVRLATVDVKSDIPSEGKFGVDAKTAVELLVQARQMGLEPYGLSFHVGSQMKNVRAWPAAIKQAAQVMDSLQEQGIILKMIDIGGGYPAFHAVGLPEMREFGQVIMCSLVQDLPYQPEYIATEPGRGLAADAGVMVATVLDVIPRAGDNWVYTDLGGFTMMESLQTNYTWQFPLADSKQSTTKMKCTITAATCDSADTIMFDRAGQLSANLEAGDRIFFYTSGAYTTVYASEFNGFSRPAVHYA